MHRQPVDQLRADLAGRDDPASLAAQDGLLLVDEGAGDAAVTLLERQRRPVEVLAHLRVLHGARRQRGGAIDRAGGRLPDALEIEHGAVDGISGEHLVGALAGEHHDHFFASALRQVVERDAGRVRHRLVEVPDESRQEGGEVLRRHHHFAVVGVQGTRDPAGLVQLGGPVLGEVPDREALHALAAALAPQVDHVGGDGRGIEAAGEEDAERHVGHQADLHGVPQALPEVRGQLVVGAQVGLGREHGPPVAAHAQLAVLVRRARGGRQLVDPRERRQSRRDVTKAQVEVQGLLVQLARHRRIAEQRLHLRAEREPLPSEVVVERLLP